MSSSTTSTSTATRTSLDQTAMENLQAVQEEIETSSQYFKPKDGNTYIIKLNPQNEIISKENDRFKDTNGKPIKRYEFKITHVNTGKEQLWDTSKTVCLQLIELLRKKFTTFKVTRNGSDRSTIYIIEGIQ